jgi:hypothetical protein
VAFSPISPFVLLHETPPSESNSSPELRHYTVPIDDCDGYRGPAPPLSVPRASPPPTTPPIYFYPVISHRRAAGEVSPKLAVNQSPPATSPHRFRKRANDSTTSPNSPPSPAPRPLLRHRCRSPEARHRSHPKPPDLAGVDRRNPR